MSRKPLLFGTGIVLAAMLALGLQAGPGLGQVSCNPSFVQSKVDGSVQVHCGAGRADLQRIAASLERSRREGRTGQASLQHTLATMNEILGGFDRRMSRLERGMAEIRAASSEMLGLLRAMSEGRLQPGPQYMATRVATAGAPPNMPDSITLRSLWPNWNQVVERYPELQAVYGRGPESLCMRCVVQPNGSLGRCRLAGADNEPRLGDAARKMATLMRVYSPYGEYIGGRSIVIPITFGVSRANQSRPRFCSMFDNQDYRS
jgi:hypothetical protein